jgi:protein gp37
MDLLNDDAPPIKALSLWQPWASLMAARVKIHETRHWKTDYRGPIAIHAAKTRDFAGAPDELCAAMFGKFWTHELPRVLQAGRDRRRPPDQGRPRRRQLRPRPLGLAHRGRPAAAATDPANGPAGPVQLGPAGGLRSPAGAGAGPWRGLPADRVGVMAEHTHISWADSTLNIWAGCTKVGPACDGCYAEHLMDHRLGRAKWGPHEERVEMKHWRSQLRRISRLALAAGRPWFVFVNSLSDFWDKQADPSLRAAALADFAQHPHLTLLLLTKRPQNIQKMATAAGGLPANCAIGCTIVTQAEADRDTPFLLAAKAALSPAFAFVSMEPLIEAVDLDGSWHGESALTAECWGDCAWCEKGHPPLHNCQKGQGNFERPHDGLDWVITGGETDQGPHKARPSHPDWFRGLRDQCAAADVAFHHKQNGEWVSVSEVEGPGAHHIFPDGATVRRTGKRLSGRSIDGVIHDARPETRP